MRMSWLIVTEVQIKRGLGNSSPLFPYSRIPREGQHHAGRVSRHRNLFLPLQPQLPFPVVFLLTYLVIIAVSPEAILLRLEGKDLTS